MKKIINNCKRCGCPSDMIETFKDSIEVKRREDPKGNIFYILSNANRYSCQCPKCGYMVKHFGSLYSTIELWNYINRVCKEVTQVNE